LLAFGDRAEPGAHEEIAAPIARGCAYALHQRVGMPVDPRALVHRPRTDEANRRAM
jgi:hypothetical protein